MPGSSTEIELPVSQGRILKFDEPVESVVLSDPAIADLKVVSDDVIYIYGTKVGTTDLVAMTADKRIKTALKLHVKIDTATTEEASNELRLTANPDITFFGSRPVVRGTAANIDQAIDLDNVAQAHATAEEPALNAGAFQGSQQVNIRVRFAEVSRNGLESLGINWSAVAGVGNFSFGVLRNNPFPSEEGGIRARFKTGSVNIDVLVDALKRRGILSVLAEPNLTAVTGQTASFLAGGEIPVPVPQGDERITIDYKPFGVSLLFTPTMMKGNRIGLRIRPEVSTLSSTGAVMLNGFAMPAFNIRRADTTVEAASGQTFAIAGLFQRNMSQELSKFPILGDVPVLGSLFNSKRYQRDETELVILITPYLVEPVSDKSLSTPLEEAALAGSAPAPRTSKAYGLVVK
ncbi:type II and III secretion system protein RhcC2 [Agaricicola taiwanensis]|uniref:Type II and III secretion system protein RhcC2 n=1 Tax=Agaricicola taiwanensis TaxID=591372 RepID=A0A8J2VP55_9RHOB|nr:type II and III secretion system protein family protein [Agaricicola taiwanensis]GGE36022.1 type II and III secretion system protein RhcC2 [Agaricicola taiwanensis]